MTSETRTVVITGAGTGVGEACARQQATLGNNVVLIGRRREPLEALAEEIGAMVLSGDAASASEWKGFCERILKTFGRINSLICSAGGHDLGAATDMSDEDWQWAMRLNLDTAFYSARACLPHLIESEGTMVLLGSLASFQAGRDVCGYTTAKHALVGLTRSLARDYGPKGVRVNCVCPGWIRTPMADEEMQPLMAHYNESLDDAYARVTRDVPLRRAACAEEIAEICAFLVSPASAIITGAMIMADGGSHIVDIPTLAFEALSPTA
ncbi:MULTISPECIES: SDR family NAD(P)-dependent oxidoreductase [Halomonas]|uniref:SDR family NAD(P)-dependent oxidoreductase n=1 Tax=Halomonas TaxID=2745 RepID=UPI001867F4BB|nr:SDR family oxidoreductase [Halomonas citrativorans]